MKMAQFERVSTFSPGEPRQFGNGGRSAAKQVGS